MNVIPNLIRNPRFLNVKEVFLNIKEEFLDLKEVFLNLKEVSLDLKEGFLNLKEEFLKVKEGLSFRIYFGLRASTPLREQWMLKRVQHDINQ